MDISQNIYQLTEIKKGQTGTGLLIENDGHIITEQDNIKQIREDIESGHKIRMSRPLCRIRSFPKVRHSECE